VTFTYPGSVAPAIHDVSVRAEPGEFVALVGPSGAGKSTVIRLLLGFETPTSGRVSYDDRDLAEVDVRLVRRQLGVILQRVRLVRGSLLDNILASTPGVDEAAAWRAAELAGIADDILRLPLGMHTRVGEDNQTFSGGQVQRLLIARALVRQPAVLLFDEATSALDNTTQREVCDRIADLACTRIVIAHRLSTICRADRIYVIEGGRVVTQGTYAGLTGRDGTFARLIERQELSCPTP
jgi:ABC-type bacteriocin/lantibiotic exporter with double-glycine peptidase domain